MKLYEIGSGCRIHSGGLAAGRCRVSEIIDRGRDTDSERLVQ